MKIALALSGGGTRAAVFHLGVLKRLACSNLLESVTRLSTVSGGSLVAGLIMCRAGLKWPTSSEYLQVVFPELERLLSTVNLFDIGTVARSPSQWRKVFWQRASIVAALLEKRWDIRGSLKELPDAPEWLINTTCIQTGKNWRLSKHLMGDWVFGHNYDPPYSIAESIAASAAVPYVIGALKLAVPKDGWFSIDPSNENPLKRKEQTASLVSLWDGGAYENLGIEPFFKLDRGMINCDEILISDASGPLPNNAGSSLLQVLKGNLASPRLFDITSDQIRGLRSRIFVHALTSGLASGALFRLGMSVRDVDIRVKRERSTSDYATFQTDKETSVALRYPTNLSALSKDDFLRVARHGFEVADATLTAYRPTLAPSSISWS